MCKEDWSGRDEAKQALDHLDPGKAGGYTMEELTEKDFFQAKAGV